MNLPDKLEEYLTIYSFLKDLSLMDQDLYNRLFDPIADYLDVLYFKMSSNDLQLLSDKYF